MHRFLMPCAHTAAAFLIAIAVAAAGGAGSAAGAGSPCGHESRAPAWRHIVVIAFENHSYGQILGPSAPASEFTKLAAECGSATDYQAVHFPRSLPNYLGATGGATVTTSDCVPGPGCSSSRSSIFSQVGGLHWRLFAESMPAPCYRQNTSLYVPRHAPAVYYTRIPRAVCGRDMVALPSHPLELHVSNPSAREAWRRVSVIAPSVTGVVAGFGRSGYRLAVDAAVTALEGRG